MVLCQEKVQVKSELFLKPLLSAPDRAYDKPVYGGVGKDMEESEAEFRAETQETTGIHEGNAAGRT